MRSLYIFLQASVASIVGAATCTMNDYGAMTSELSAMSTGFEKCLALMDPAAAWNCLSLTAGSIDNTCVQCIVGSIKVDQIACMMRCATGISMEGCDRCMATIMYSLISCIPAELATMLQSQLGNLSTITSGLGDIFNSTNGEDNYDGPTWGGPRPPSEEGMRCRMRDLKHLIPRGHSDIETLIDCFVTKSESEDWSSCFPEVSNPEHRPDSSCTECLTTVLSQGAKLSCSTQCSGDLSNVNECRECLVNVGSMGFGRCTGMSEPPMPFICTTADQTTYSSNEGASILLACIQADPSTVSDCLSQSAVLGNGAIQDSCLACLSKAPSWTSAIPIPVCSCAVDANSMNLVCDGAGCGDSPESITPDAPLVVDSVFVDHCFDPNSLRRSVQPEDIPCSLDDLSEMSKSADEMVDCMTDSDRESCMQTHSSNVSGTCNSCLAYSLPSTCDSSDCWDEALATSAGSCLYYGYPVSALETSSYTTTSSPTETTTSGSLSLLAGSMCGLLAIVTLHISF